MDQLIFASLSHTHYWYEVGMLKVQVTQKNDCCATLKVTQRPQTCTYSRLERILLLSVELLINTTSI